MLIGDISENYSTDAFAWMPIYNTKWDVNNSKLTIKFPHKLPDSTDIYINQYDITISGVPYISIPAEPFMHFESFFSKNAALSIMGLSQEGYLIGSSMEPIGLKYFPEFTFEINGKISIIMNSSSYLTFSNDRRSFIARVRMNDENHVILGGPFLSRIHLVLDYEKRKIGIAE